tara:strand:+ start:739 stop:1602 length:864 start_codon:yes stop_codon:yes gene_type:complete
MEKLSNKDKISCLIRLIDDRDPFIRNRVREELLEIGEDAIPFLEMAARQEDPGLSLLARKILSDLLPIQLTNRFRQLQQPGGDIDLEKGVFLLMQYGYPDANPAKYSAILDLLAQEVGSRIPVGASSEKTVEILTDFLSREKGFCGNKKVYFSPDNTFFNKVLEEKTGIPISISILYIFVAARLGIPVYGVGMPCHFIVKYEAPGNPIYFDPFHNGNLLSREDCVQMAESFGLKFEEHFLCQSSNREILVRMINNLIMVYGKTSELDKVNQLGEYVRILTQPRKRVY